MKQFYKFIICAFIFSFLLLPKISQCQWANPSYGGYYNYGQPYNYGGYSIYGQPLPDYGGSYFNNNGFNSGYPNYFNYNNLPDMFKNLAEAEEKKVLIDRSTKNMTYLDYHSTNPATEQKINEQKWDYVLLQGVCTNCGYPETHHHLGFLPTHKLKMVVQRCHFKHSFPLPPEPDNLDDNR